MPHEIKIYWAPEIEVNYEEPRGKCVPAETKVRPHINTVGNLNPYSIGNMWLLQKSSH